MARTDIDEALVKRLATLLEDHKLTEIEYSGLTWRLRLSRAAPTMIQPMASPVAATVAPAPSPDSKPAASPGGDKEGESRAAHPGAVSSPMVGTVYVAAEPGADPFVREGDTVVEGQTLLIVEAMKTMNPIRAPRAGRVTQIFVQNAAPVEYGEVLLIIE